MDKLLSVKTLEDIHPQYRPKTVHLPGWHSRTQRLLILSLKTRV
jgi:hypothetical protein